MHQLELSIDGNTVRKRVVAPHIQANLSPAKPTEVYDTYWKFAAERQRILHAQAAGIAPPWTDDPILRHHKFTNAYRAADRTSQYLIRHVIYEGSWSVPDTVFRILLFKFFNKIETWKLLERTLGEISWQSYDYGVFDRVLTTAFEAGSRIYSAAYILPSPQTFGAKRKHRNHLQLLEHMMEDGIAERITSCSTMQEGFDILRSYPSIGDFLAYQYIIDLNYSEIIDYSENSFVVPGPGAVRGIRKCFSDTGGLSDVEVIQVVMDRQQEEFDRLGESFQDLWGRPLHLIDCQNLFCEVDKYARVAHPRHNAGSARSRIKQAYAAAGRRDRIEFFFPPKWGINSALPREA